MRRLHPKGRRGASASAGSRPPGLPSAASPRAGSPPAERTRPALPGSEASDEIIISELVAPHGVNGLVRGLTLTEFPEDLDRLKEVILDGPRREIVRLLKIQTHGRLLLFQFEGVESFEAAEALRGMQVKIPRSQAHALPPGHYYVGDIVGMEVFTEDGRSIGRIREVLQTGSNDVYRTEQALIPATREAVTTMDVPGRRMVVQSNLIVED